MEDLAKQKKKQNLNSKNSWSPEDEQKLSELVNTFKFNWRLISEQIRLYTPTQCRNHWNRILKNGNIKGPWSEQEDKLLMEWVKKNGAKNWTKCSEYVYGRSGKQCREHWNNSLNPTLIKGNWTSEEDFLIMYFYKKYNGSWKKIINLFEGRTENSIKNRFFSQLRKIAGENMDSNEKQLSSKIRLQTLLNYYEKATLDAKESYLSENPQKEEDLNKYLNLLEQKIINAKSKVRTYYKKENNYMDNNDTNSSTSINDNNKKKTVLLKKRKRSKDENEEIIDNEKIIGNKKINENEEIIENTEMNEKEKEIIKEDDADKNLATQQISKETTNDINLNEEENNKNTQNQEYLSKKSEFQKIYTINKNIPTDCEEEELLVPCNSNSNNSNETNKNNNSYNTPLHNTFNYTYLNINNQTENQINHNNPFYCFPMEISSFKIDGHTMPFHTFNPPYQIINDNNEEFYEILKSKPSTSSVNGCKVVDNDNELNKPFERKNINKNNCYYLLKNSKESIMKYKGL